MSAHTHPLYTKVPSFVSSTKIKNAFIPQLGRRRIVSAVPPKFPAPLFVPDTHCQPPKNGCKPVNVGLNPSEPTCSSNRLSVFPNRFLLITDYCSTDLPTTGRSVRSSGGIFTFSPGPDFHHLRFAQPTYQATRLHQRLYLFMKWRNYAKTAVLCQKFIQ